MLILNFILLAFLKGVLGKAPDQCMADPLTVCYLDVKTIQELPFSKDVLDSFCRAMLFYYKCVEELKDEFSIDKLCDFPLIVAKAEGFIRKKFCGKTFLQKRYLKHADCFRKIRDKFTDCQKYAATKLKLYRLHSEDIGVTMDPLEADKGCMLASLKTICLREKIKKSCGDEALSVFTDMYDGTKFNSYFCPEHQYSTAIRRAEMILRIIGDDGKI